jgi:hypothetical protein
MKHTCNAVHTAIAWVDKRITSRFRGPGFPIFQTINQHRISQNRHSTGLSLSNELPASLPSKPASFVHLLAALGLLLGFHNYAGRSLQRRTRSLLVTTITQAIKRHVLPLLRGSKINVPAK